MQAYHGEQQQQLHVACSVELPLFLRISAAQWGGQIEVVRGSDARKRESSAERECSFSFRRRRRELLFIQ